MNNIKDALLRLAAGKMIIVVDDENRENEGDIIVAAEFITSESIAFMMNHARGLICLAMEGTRLDELDIPLMVERNTDSMKTAFTVSIDYAPQTTTGISAADRAATIRAVVNPHAKSNDFSKPGHIFPLRAHPGGILARPGHTEAAVDLCRLAGIFPAGVICEITNKDGSMARLPDLQIFARIHGMPIISIEALKACIQCPILLNA